MDSTWGTLIVLAQNDAGHNNFGGSPVVQLLGGHTGSQDFGI